MDINLDPPQVASLPSRPSSIWNPLSARCQMTILMLAAVTANTFVRNTISMAIVCMVKNTAARSGDGNMSANSTEDECGPVIHEDDSAYDGDLLWTSQEKSYVISALYWGGLLTALPAGYLADRYSPKLIVTLCQLINMIGCLLTPVAAVYGGLWSVFTLRFIMGLGGQATIYPPISTMCARWIPTSERSTVIAIYTAGAQVGTIIGAPINAFLCRQKHFLGGWPSIFYLNGLVCAPILLLWCLLAKNSPESYKWIKQPEINFIQTSLSKQHIAGKIKWRDVPWCLIIASPAVLVTLIGTFGPAVFFLATAFMTCHQQFEAVAFLTVAAGLFACQTAGFLTSLSSMAPRYTGTINALSRFFGQIGSVVAPMIVGVITVKGTSAEWQVVFYIMTAIMGVSGLLFLFFGSASIQKWAQKENAVGNVVPQTRIITVSTQEANPTRNSTQN